MSPGHRPGLERGPPPQSPLSRGLPLLVVEPAATAESAAVVLRASGFTVLGEVADADRAWVCLEAQHWALLLVALDFPLGVELVRRVRADRRFGALPVVMALSEARRDQVVAAVRAGVDAYLLRPLQSAPLQERLASALARRAGARR
jgi:two-component system chemotaxis response regulator CheY